MREGHPQVGAAKAWPSQMAKKPSLTDISMLSSLSLSVNLKQLLCITRINSRSACVFVLVLELPCVMQ